MSMILPPKELIGKIDFVFGSFVLKDNIKITDDEKKIFEKYKEVIEYSQKHRYD